MLRKLIGTVILPLMVITLSVPQSPRGLGGPISVRVSLPPGAPAYPMKMSTNHRYLVDQNNVPFLMVGDSPQALIANLSEADAEFYFADRQAKGFNTVWINLLCKPYTGCRDDGSTFDGILPFTTSEDLSKPNPSYFARADDMIQLAAQHGLLVLLDPIETGGWLSTLQSNGTTKARAYGVYLGNRYKNFPNIVWMSGNDFQSWMTSSDDDLVRAVAEGIQSADPNHLQTSELNYNASGSLDDSTWAPLIGLDSAYTYYPTYAQVLTEYDRASFRPVFMVEANYEGENNTGQDPSTPEVLRRQEYWTMLSGATGQLYGSTYTWPFRGDWKNNLDTLGVTQLGYMQNLFAERAWFNLTPDQVHSVVIAGYGTYTDTGAVHLSDYLTAARTPDGRLVLAYLPTTRTITVDMTRLAGPVTAAWFDPANGVSTAIAGSPFPNTGTRQFTPTGPNSDGDGDWVLILQAPPAHEVFLPAVRRP